MAKANRVRSGKADLLRAASELFAQRPYSEVGIAEILGQSGVKAPSLYHHFGDKEGLFVAWAEFAFLRLHDRIRALPPLDEPIEALIQLAIAIGDCDWIDIWRTLECRPRFEKAESSKRIESAYFGAIVEPTCLALMQARDSGVISIDSIDKTAAMFLSGVFATSARSPLPASGADSNYRWQVHRMVFGFVRPLP